LWSECGWDLYDFLSEFGWETHPRAIVEHITNLTDDDKIKSADDVKKHIYDLMVRKLSESETDTDALEEVLHFPKENWDLTEWRKLYTDVKRNGSPTRAELQTFVNNINATKSKQEECAVAEAERAASATAAAAAGHTTNNEEPNDDNEQSLSDDENNNEY